MMTTKKHLLKAIFSMLLVATGCSKEEHEDGGPEMRPGENCNGCHSFWVAGTLFKTPDAAAHEGISGGVITLTGSDGKKTVLTSNRVGNFFSDVGVSFPATAEVTKDGVTRSMTGKVTSGACSHCHTSPPGQGAPGRLFVGD